MEAYIIHFDDKPWEDLDDELYYRCSEIPWFSTTKTTISRLIPYTEDSAYAHGYTEAESKYREIRDELETQAYQKGLSDAWEAARKIVTMPNRDFINSDILDLDPGESIFIKYTAPEAIEKIRQYEQRQEEKEEKDSVTAEEVMRQYLDRFCKSSRCGECVLHTSDFTCGRGYHFLTKSCVSDEEVRKAYATVLAKMKE